MFLESDLYSVLGVSPDAEAVVITAAYRALSAKYHPDRWTGEAQFAHERMAEINMAYETLGDERRRRDYDSRRPQGAEFRDSEDQAQAFEQALTGYEERWQVACSVFPQLNDLRAKLAKTSYQLAFSFVVVMLEGKDFQHQAEIASAMEQTFLERHFGTNRRVIDFARELIQIGARDAVKALNKLVDVLGSKVEPGLIIDRVSRDYRIVERTRAAIEGLHSEAVRQRQREQMRVDQRMLLSRPTLDLARRLADFFGYDVTETSVGLFRGSEYLVRARDSADAGTKLSSAAAFVRWAQENFARKSF